MHSIITLAWWFVVYDFALSFFQLDCLKHDLIKEQSRNHELESQVKTLRHENYQMKMTKTHQKQDYVWNIAHYKTH